MLYVSTKGETETQGSDTYLTVRRRARRHERERSIRAQRHR
jgi:hypothetical protein